jgi:RHS repeat-associated protein
MFGILRQDGAYFSIYGGIGSTLALTDQTGTPLVRYTYDPFGNTQSTNPAIPNPFQFTSRENDGAGLYYYRQRYYSPVLHRFLSEDPIGLLGGENFYRYVLNNPLAFTDPLGLDVTITLYPGALGFAHIGVGVNTSQTTGFYNAPTADPVSVALSLNVTGIVKPDTRQPIHSITIPRSPSQDRAMQAVINQALTDQANGKPRTYNLTKRNCALFVQEVLAAGGLQVPNTKFPRGLMDYLQQRYGPPELSVQGGGGGGGMSNLYLPSVQVP